MKTVAKRQKTRDEERKMYEAMFLVGSAEAAADWDGITAAIKNILEKAGAEIVSMRKWDERRLAYEINGRSRGTYILCYFKAEGRGVREIERDVQLSERIMRVLILRTEEQAAEREQKTDDREQKTDEREQKNETSDI